MYSYNFPLSLTQTLCSDRTGWLWTGALSSFHTPSNTFVVSTYAHRTGHINLTQRNLNATVGGGGGGCGARSSSYIGRTRFSLYELPGKWY